MKYLKNVTLTSDVLNGVISNDFEWTLTQVSQWRYFLKANTSKQWIFTRATLC